MKKITVILLVIFLFSSRANSQTWPKIYYYGGMSTSSSQCAEETYDKGFAILSNLGGFPYPVVAGWLIKTDINGEVLWERTLGSLTNYWTNVIDVKTTTDSGFIISLNTNYTEINPFGGTKDL